MDEYQRCIYCGGNAEERGHRKRCDGRQGTVEAEVPQGPAVFNPKAAFVDVTGMVQGNGHATSYEAAELVEPHRSELQQHVVAAFEHYGAMTDEMLEQLVEFHEYAPTTVRKRRTELAQKGVLVCVGSRMNSRGNRQLLFQIPR